MLLFGKRSKDYLPSAPTIEYYKCVKKIKI